MSSEMMSSCAWAGVPGVIGYRVIHYLSDWSIPGQGASFGHGEFVIAWDPPNPEFRQQANALAREIENFDDPKSGEHAGKIAKNLHKLLYTAPGVEPD